LPEEIENGEAARDGGKWLVNVDSKGQITGQNSKRGQQWVRVDNEPNLKKVDDWPKSKMCRQRAKVDNEAKLPNGRL
jgi:hypothetical protein